MGSTATPTLAETPKVARLGLSIRNDPADTLSDQVGLRSPFANGDPAQALGLVFGEIHGCLAHCHT